MSSTPDAPAAPDYKGAAEATAAGNIAAAEAAAKANRVDSYTPYGTQTYTQDPSTKQWRTDIHLSPEQQALLDQQNKTSLGLGALQGDATKRIAMGLGSPMPSTYDPKVNSSNASALLDARLLPQQEIDRHALDAQLANQGITAGSEAYRNAQDQLGRQQNDARLQNQLQGESMGAQQQQQQYMQGMQSRQAPINELNALRTGAQVTNPNFGSVAQQATTPGADMVGALNGQNNYNMGLYNSEVATNNSNTQAGAGALATAVATYAAYAF